MLSAGDHAAHRRCVTQVERALAACGAHQQPIRQRAQRRMRGHAGQRAHGANVEHAVRFPDGVQAGVAQVHHAVYARERAHLQLTNQLRTARQRNQATLVG